MFGPLDLHDFVLVRLMAFGGLYAADSRWLCYLPSLRSHEKKASDDGGISPESPETSRNNASPTGTSDCEGTVVSTV